MNDIEKHFIELFNQASEIWVSGGWAMIAIAIIALTMFAIGVSMYIRLQAKGFAKVPEKKWRKWIDNPQLRRGPIGSLLDFVTGGNSLEDTALYFDELRITEILPFDRDLKIMKICVSAAPLLGLLGTVTGMLTTFDALANGSGGEKTMGLVAKGISEALITTETGLVIALPGLFFQYILARQQERYKVFLAHLETVCTQIQFKKLNASQKNVG